MVAYRNFAKDVINRFRQLFEVHWHTPEIDLTPVTVVNDDQYGASNVARSVTATAGATTSTIFAVPAASSNREFYLNSANLAAAFTAASDVTIVSINATVEGTARIIASICKVAALGSSGTASFSPKKPLRVDPGTNITFTSDGTSLSQSFAASITGYLTPTSSRSF